MNTAISSNMKLTTGKETRTMKIKGNQTKIQEVIKAHGLVIESQKTTGNFTSYRLKRRDKAMRIIPAGGNYSFDGEYLDGKRWRYAYHNVHCPRLVIDKPMPNTTILGNAAWYDLITELFESGAAERIDVLNERFTSVEQYHDYCENSYYIDLVQAEREANGN
jgi:hypothetical protein